MASSAMTASSSAPCGSRPSTATGLSLTDRTTATSRTTGNSAHPPGRRPGWRPLRRSGCGQPLAKYKTRRGWGGSIPSLLLVRSRVQSMLLGGPVLDGGTPIGFEADPGLPDRYDAASDRDGGMVVVMEMRRAEADGAVLVLRCPRCFLRPSRPSRCRPTFAAEDRGVLRANPLWGHGPYGGVVQGPAGGRLRDVDRRLAVFLTSTAPPTPCAGSGA